MRPNADENTPKTGQRDCEKLAREPAFVDPPSSVVLTLRERKRHCGSGSGEGIAPLLAAAGAMTVVHHTGKSEVVHKRPSTATYGNTLSSSRLNDRKVTC